MELTRLVAAILLGALLAAASGIAAWLWTPVAPFDRAAAIEAGTRYDARIIRDAFGVPHIYGARDADVAFGLAFAHAEDDWPTMAEVVRFARGELGLVSGRDGAVTDYLLAAMNIRADIAEQYETALSTEVRAILEAYADGLNFWCAQKEAKCARGTAPVTGQDIAAGFAARGPFFYGLDEHLTRMFEADADAHRAALRAREVLLKVHAGVGIGSNAIAVAPARSADGHTRLMVNSHQPYTGPVAWYEARLKSGEGWDMIGGVFPGAPMILHGAGPLLGWAFTVNKPDLVDIYALEVDNPKSPRKYRFDGAWRDFERSSAKLRVKLLGPFSLPVRRDVLRSVHGPVFTAPGGVFAVSYAGMGDIRGPEQYYRMNKARNFADWRDAMAMQAIPSLHAVYADREGAIAYFYNAAIPVRSPQWDWSKIAPGERADLVWRGVRPFGSAPSIVNPASGYVVNGNNGPFEASDPDDIPPADAFPAEYGIDSRRTNRGARLLELYGADEAITAENFVAYKMDNRYTRESRLRRMIAALLADGAAQGDAALEPALTLLADWDGATDLDNRGAALAVRTGQLALGFLLNGEGAEEPDPAKALRRAVSELHAGFGRIDPPWRDVMRLRRGEIDMPLQGGPDTLRAVYGAGAPTDGAMTATGGDTYILVADWPPDSGAPAIRTIHQFGSATLDESSPHFADQAPLFAEERWKTPPLSLDALLAEATADYAPGKRGR